MSVKSTALVLAYGLLCAVMSYALKLEGVAYLAFLVAIAGLGAWLGRALAWVDDPWSWR